MVHDEHGQLGDVARRRAGSRQCDTKVLQRLPDLQPEVRLFEPRLALAGGDDGLSVYRRLVQDAAGLLKAEGWLVMEVGQGQAESVRMLLDATKGYGTVDVRPDQAGIDRVVCAKLKGSGQG